MTNNSKVEMTTEQEKYQNGKIYKITGTDDSMVYIGSTMQKIGERMSKHLNKYRRWKLGKEHMLTVFNIFDKFGVENCKIQLIEEYSCKSKQELEKREGIIIKNTTGCVNRIIVGRTRGEYYTDNREKKLSDFKKYRGANHESIKSKRSEHIRCECGIESTRGHISNHRKTIKHMEIMHGKTSCKICKVNCEDYGEHKKLADHKINLIEWFCA